MRDAPKDWGRIVISAIAEHPGAKRMQTEIMSSLKLVGWVGSPYCRY